MDPIQITQLFTIPITWVYRGEIRVLSLEPTQTFLLLILLLLIFYHCSSHGADTAMQWHSVPMVDMGFTRGTQKGAANLGCDDFFACQGTFGGSQLDGAQFSNFFPWSLTIHTRPWQSSPMSWYLWSSLALWNLLLHLYPWLFNPNADSKVNLAAHVVIISCLKQKHSRS